MMTQGEAVYAAVSEVFGEVRPVPPTTAWNDSQKEKAYALVLQAFKSGVCQHKSNPSAEELVKYIPGLVNNWVRKDKRLNGGSAYTPKRPGSRTGSGDSRLIALKQLGAIAVDPKVKADILAEIEKRVAELKPKVEVDISALPEHLRYLVKK